MRFLAGGFWLWGLIMFLASTPWIRSESATFLAAYRWRPFEPVQRPARPTAGDPKSGLNPIDAFVAAERSARKLTPRPEAARDVLLRRVYLDLIGLSPTPEEQRADFLFVIGRDAGKSGREGEEKAKG